MSCRAIFPAEIGLWTEFGSAISGAARARVWMARRAVAGTVAESGGGADRHTFTRLSEPAQKRRGRVGRSKQIRRVDFPAGQFVFFLRAGPWAGKNFFPGDCDSEDSL